MPSDNSLASLLRRYQTNPLLFTTEALRVTPEPWQAKVLEAWPDRPRASIRSGHGVGKSALLSWLILHHQLTRFPAKTGTTAPTEHQLRDVLWAELGTWLKRLPEAWQQQYSLTDLRLELKASPEESFAAGKVARPEKPEAFAGYHSPNMLLVGDEASGIAEAVFETGLGAMSTPGARMILTGNPTRPDGFFHATHTRLRERWWTLRVGSDEVERARGHIDDVVATYGRDSNAYRVRVLGEFPTTADEQVIPLDWVEAAVKRAVEPSELYRVVWGLDVARFGDDRSALAKRRGRVLLEPIKSWRGKDTMQTAGMVRAEYEATFKDERPSEILVDAIGIGAGVVDRLVELGLPARGVNVGEAPAAGERYMRQRDELWWRAREWFGARDCKIADDPALIAELTAPLYSFSSAGKLLVESKDEQKKRIGRSPDLADAFVLTMAGGLDRVDEHSQDRYARKTRRYGGASWMST